MNDSKTANNINTQKNGTLIKLHQVSAKLGGRILDRVERHSCSIHNDSGANTQTMYVLEFPESTVTNLLALNDWLSVNSGGLGPTTTIDILTKHAVLQQAAENTEIRNHIEQLQLMLTLLGYDITLL